MKPFDKERLRLESWTKSAAFSFSLQPSAFQRLRFC